MVLESCSDLSRPLRLGILECLPGFVQLEPKRTSYVGGPQTFSVTFNEDGFVSKITVSKRLCGLLYFNKMRPEYGINRGSGSGVGPLRQI